MVSEWASRSHTGLIDIGTHRIHARIAGPDRRPDEPLVIIMHGLASTMSEWPAAFRAISSHCRVLDYDRSGYGESDVAVAEPTGENVAIELNALLRATALPPPYITVGHSWGGVTSLEFLASRVVGDVAGMIFVDANSPRHFETVPKLSEQEFVKNVCHGVDYVEAIEMGKHTVLSDQEWKEFTAAEHSEKLAKQQERDRNAYSASFVAVQEKQLLERHPPVLGMAPVVVLRGSTERDQESMMEAGIAKGNGTPEDHLRYRAMLDAWADKDISAQKEFFRLTAGKKKFLQAPKSGHNVQLTEPEYILEAVKWVLRNKA